MTLETTLCRESPVAATVDCVVVGVFADATFTRDARSTGAPFGVNAVRSTPSLVPG